MSNRYKDGGLYEIRTRYKFVTGTYDNSFNNRPKLFFDAAEVLFPNNVGNHICRGDYFVLGHPRESCVKGFVNQCVKILA